MDNLTFPIIYKNERFLVDPILLCNKSQKFQYLMNQNEGKTQNFCLKITYNFFTTRNVSNFLKIIQDQATDVQKSEIKEICLLAKMFQADDIFNKAFNFIKEEIDNNFFIPSDQLKEISQSLVFESESNENSNAFHCDLNELEFDDSCTENDSKNNNKISDDKYNNNHLKNISVCYKIKLENPILKCHRFYFMEDDKVVFTAKQKFDDIVIAEGKNCHFKESEQTTMAKIKRDYKGLNIATVRDQEIKIRYLKDGEKFLVKTEFNHRLGKQTWTPKQIKCDEMFKGQFDHKFIKSNRNIILQNTKKHPTFILRKTAKKIFEVE